MRPDRQARSERKAVPRVVAALPLCLQPGGHTESCPGEACLPRPRLPAPRPRGGSLPCPGPELLTSSDECGLEGGFLNQTCDPRPVLSSDLVRRPESLVDVLHKVYHKLYISSKGSWKLEETHRLHLFLSPRCFLTWFSQGLPYKLHSAPSSIFSCPVYRSASSPVSSP